MAQPTRCDGHVGRRRLSHHNLRREPMAKKAKKAVKKKATKKKAAKKR